MSNELMNVYCRAGCPDGDTLGIFEVAEWGAEQIKQLQSELNDRRETICRLLSELDAVPEWISVEERMPEGVVLACYTNNYSKHRIIRARYIQKFMQESEDIDDFDAQYDEESDTYYDAEGWYECIDNWGDYSSVAVTEGTVTHWRPLPAPPVSPIDEGKV